MGLKLLGVVWKVGTKEVFIKKMRKLHFLETPFSSSLNYLEAHQKQERSQNNHLTAKILSKL